MTRKIIPTANAAIGQWRDYSSHIMVYMGRVYESRWEGVEGRKLEAGGLQVGL